MRKACADSFLMGVSKKVEAEFATSSWLRSFPFFSEFPDEVLGQISQIAVFESFAPGSFILTQGQLNQSLIFLMSGRVSVLVDDGEVAELTREGDLIGEMSVITSKPCSASIKALTKVDVLIIGIETMSAEMCTPELMQQLYKIFAFILAEKLHETNRRAKEFENLSNRLNSIQMELKLTNQSLEKKVALRTKALADSRQWFEAQNEELVVSHRKLEELYANKKATFSKLSDLYKLHLVPLNKSLSQIESQGLPTAQQQTVQQLRRRLDLLLSLMEPLAHVYSIDLAARPRKVLLFEPVKKKQVVVKLALGGSGVELELVEDDDQFKDLIHQTHFDIILVDQEKFEQVKATLENLQSESRVVVMVDGVSQGVLPDWLRRGVRPTNMLTRVEDRSITVKNILTAVTKLTSKEVFGLEKYLAWGVEVQKLKVARSDRRGHYIEQVSEYFSTLGIRRSVRDKIELVLEELLMNVIYDAPIGSDGRPIYNHLPRTSVVSLKPDQQSTLTFATDGIWAAVAVEDPFGSLHPETIFQYLENVYSGLNDLNAQLGKGGAGRGLHMIVENSDLIVYNIQPGVRTEGLALFRLEAKEVEDPQPSLHLFVV